jgi:hypothetical protein
MHATAQSAYRPAEQSVLGVWYELGVLHNGCIVWTQQQHAATTSDGPIAAVPDQVQMNRRSISETSGLWPSARILVGMPLLL